MINFNVYYLTSLLFLIGVRWYALQLCFCDSLCVFCSSLCVFCVLLCVFCVTAISQSFTKQSHEVSQSSHTKFHKVRRKKISAYKHLFERFQKLNRNRCSDDKIIIWRPRCGFKNSVFAVQPTTFKSANDVFCGSIIEIQRKSWCSEPAGSVGCD